MKREVGWWGQNWPPQVSGAAHQMLENQRPVAFGSFSSHIPLPGTSSLPPWKEGGEKGNLETIKASSFHFQGAGWGRLLPGASRGPSQPGWGRRWAWRQGQQAWGLGELLPGPGGLFPELSGRPASQPSLSSKAPLLLETFSHPLKQISTSDPTAS